MPRNSSSGSRSLGTSILVALTLVAPLVGGVAWVIAASSESPLESAANVEPLVGTIERAERFQEAQAALAVEFADAVSPATQSSGTLTALHVSDGAEVATGAVVADVNNQHLVAYSSASPLYRDVSRGLTGADVSTAQQLLVDLGYLTGAVDGRAGYATETAIKAFNRAHGYGATNTVLSLSSLVWIGTGPVTIDEMSVALGGTVSPGTELFTTTAGIAAITVFEPPSLPQGADLQLSVNGITTPYALGSGRVTDPEAIVAIVASLGTATEGVGTLRLSAPVVVGTVPSSAVVTDDAGRVCIFASATSAGTAVTPLGGTLGTVDLDATLIGQSVLLNPRDVRQDLSCG